jgi:protein-tyrosine-phosphatase
MKPGSHENSMQLQQEELKEGTLVLTMTFSEKVTFLEQYQHEDVYTLGEFVGEDTDIMDPYGGEEEQYEKCYDDIARRVRKVIQILKEEGGKTDDSIGK